MLIEIGFCRVVGMITAPIVGPNMQPEVCTKRFPRQQGTFLAADELQSLMGHALFLFMSWVWRACSLDIAKTCQTTKTNTFFFVSWMIGKCIVNDGTGLIEFSGFGVWVPSGSLVFWWNEQCPPPSSGLQASPEKPFIRGMLGQHGKQERVPGGWGPKVLSYQKFVLKLTMLTQKVKCHDACGWSSGARGWISVRFCLVAGTASSPSKDRFKNADLAASAFLATGLRTLLGASSHDLSRFASLQGHSPSEIVSLQGPHCWCCSCVLWLCTYWQAARAEAEPCIRHCRDQCKGCCSTFPIPSKFASWRVTPLPRVSVMFSVCSVASTGPMQSQSFDCSALLAGSWWQMLQPRALPPSLQTSPPWTDQRLLVTSPSGSEHAVQGETRENLRSHLSHPTLTTEAEQRSRKHGSRATDALSWVVHLMLQWFLTW